MKNRISLFVVAAMLAASVLSFPQEPALEGHRYREVKHVIFMVPDGMGLADVTAARILKNCGNTPTTQPFIFCAEGPGGPPLNFETLEHIGYQRTYSKVNTITDSSAAASTWACGEKFVNNEVCFHADGAPNNPTLLELAKQNRWGTGLVATQTITHATPAAFGAHLADRNCETEIARQYVEETQPDVMLGGGQATFKPSAADVCGVSGDFITEAQTRGYTYVTTKQAMDDAVASGVTRLLGLFASKNLTPEYQRLPTSLQPRLPETTAAALAILEKHPTGFFLLLEGSLIDSGNHAENVQYQYGEMLAFDQSVKVVRDWINASPERKEHTLLIVAPDHETGGFAVKGLPPRGGEEPGAGLGPFLTTPVQAGVEPPGGWVFTLVPTDPIDREAHHTGGDELIWSSGPGSELLGRAIENTYVYWVVKQAIR
ncbi:MAG TPA: alkaline phosphatase [Terriglobia bacterium]|nr:alkaline phosphatase [Terriglobia bacterium]